ncbi:Trm112 family protein [Amycolatopsis sp. H20-H5]|uniref:Trm112 family protein n=1 Tax=Amycolatopsis sp. H20-H5 TaxID=3046309 RepID=UPI002DBEA35C|nr:Trm112 family protein [Amycolatopsis sp. H20-H5]MEC3980072.1 Trm112 family protein [Amycolatopsis sp. H20-H5]
MTLDERLLDILACPVDKGPLLYLPEDSLLYNPRIRRLHRIESGVPQMRADQSSTVEDDQHQKLLGKAEAGKASGTQGATIQQLLKTEQNALGNG